MGSCVTCGSSAGPTTTPPIWPCPSRSHRRRARATRTSTTKRPPPRGDAVAERIADQLRRYTARVPPLALALLALTSAAPAPAADDFTADARLLYRVATCGPVDVALPSAIRPELVE